jgi:hypothetical protein
VFENQLLPLDSDASILIAIIRFDFNGLLFWLNVRSKVNKSTAHISFSHKFVETTLRHRRIFYLGGVIFSISFVADLTVQFENNGVTDRILCFCVKRHARTWIIFNLYIDPG